MRLFRLVRVLSEACEDHQQPASTAWFSAHLHRRHSPGSGSRRRVIVLAVRVPAPRPGRSGRGTPLALLTCYPCTSWPGWYGLAKCTVLRILQSEVEAAFPSVRLHWSRSSTSVTVSSAYPASSSRTIVSGTLRRSRVWTANRVGRMSSSAKCSKPDPRGGENLHPTQKMQLEGNEA
jgi:hypothetical protein